MDEVLSEQRRHIRVQLPAVGNGPIGMGLPRAAGGPSLRPRGQFPHDDAVADIPCKPRELT